MACSIRACNAVVLNHAVCTAASMWDLSRSDHAMSSSSAPCTAKWIWFICAKFATQIRMQLLDTYHVS